MSETLNQRAPQMHALLRRNAFSYLGNYRYGYNGQEKDDEVKGAGNSVDFGARIYNSKLGRFLCVNPTAPILEHGNLMNYNRNGTRLNPDQMYEFQKNIKEEKNEK